ncbi:hypothetical protein VTN77DRAFT_1327 [Rasamsonia byssochlamydoides]|uniref:uncharacterized protein n=1 Tax=Rasamsonia byssochlamydoides TaxID=89139 RepID=UPI0037444AE1
MNDDPCVQFLAARSRKRSHREMSDSHHRSQSSWPQHGEPSSSSDADDRQSHRLALPPLPQTRYPGDGYDFRRPVMSTSSHTEDVIDLTNEPDSPPQQPSRNHGPGHRPRSHRPPRFGRNIMADVVDLEEEPDPPRRDDPPSSPEVQFVRATVRPPRPQRPQSVASRARSFMGRSSLFDMLRLRPPRFASSGVLSGQDAFTQEVARRARDLAGRRPPPHGIDTLWIDDGHGEGADLTIDMDVDVPLGMDYQVAGFPMGHPARAPPQYKPPSPPPEGFARTVQEDDIVVCPNCDHELGTGDDLKQQIWVAKPCGHVYCGECAKNRAKGKKAQSSQAKTKHFSRCRVPDCDKSVSAPKAMFQIYL